MQLAREHKIAAGGLAALVLLLILGGPFVTASPDVLLLMVTGRAALVLALGLLGYWLVQRERAGRRQADAERARLLAAEQAARAEADADRRRYAILAEASTLLASSLDYETTLAAVAHLAVPTIADWCSVYIVGEDGRVRQLAVAHSDPAKVAWAEELGRRYPPDPEADRGVYHVLRTGRTEITPEITEAMIAAAGLDDERLAMLRTLGITSAITVPLRTRETIVGAITLVSAESGRRYGAAEVTLAQDLAARAAQAIDNARLYREVGAQRERFAVTLASIGDAVIATDTAGRVTFLNAIAATLTGWSQAEALGQPLTTVFTIVQEASRAAIEAPVAHVLREGTAVGLANGSILIARDGTERPIDDSAAPIRDSQGRVLGVVLVFRDISERQRAEEARHAQAAAEDANQAKNHFLSRMSHELRTPLNAILGFAQLLELSALTPDQEESIRYILRGGRHLLDLINEVLEIARIEEGQLAISPEPVAVQDIVAECLSLIRPLAQARALTVPAGPPPGGGWHVLADRQRLQQVLLNLLSNAVKYNRPGGAVRVECRLAAPGQVHLAVIDSGIGIAPAHLDRLFTPFDRLGAEQGEEEGTGLGLALSQRLMQAMGGRIGVASVVGAGSTFWIELPRVANPVDQLREPGPAVVVPVGAPGPRRRILYIEDNLSNLKLIERVLALRPEADLLSAMQGQLGLELAREHRPDLILLDVHLPDIPGDEVLSRLQADPATRAIPVLMMSADATPRQIEHLRAAGVHDYLTKPIDVKRFLAVVDELLLAG